MTTTLTDIRSGLATRLATIPGMRVNATIPEQPNPPVAIVQPESVTYDLNARNGLTQYTMVVTVIVSRADGRSAQNAIDQYVAPAGTASVKGAIEADRTLGGKVNTLRVTQVSNYAIIDALEIPYLGVDFTVEVYA
jgi:hypothetical protein